jgi:arylsulfatase A-like enzyme
MDKLAAEGTVFTNAFTTCPLCSPARGTLFTGRWTFQNGVKDNLNIGHSTQESLSKEEDTWLDAAMRRGYDTGYFGKWHLGHEKEPLKRLDLPVQKSAHRELSYNEVKANIKKIEREVLLEGNAPFWGVLPGTKEDTRAFKTVAGGVEFLERYAHSSKDTPFCLTVSTSSPHFPHYLPREYAVKANPDKVQLPVNLSDNYKNKPPFHNTPWWPSMDTEGLSEEEWKKIIAYTHQHISLTDDALGTVLDSLKKWGLEEDTIVVFTADHGDMPGAHNRFDKGAYFYEEVWRIPLVIKYPGKVPSQQESWVNLIDLAETFYELIGPDEKTLKSRFGKSLLSLVGTDKSDGRPNRAFGVYDLYNGISMAVRAIRDPRYKYIWNPQSIDEFYDLDSDPGELNNLIDSPSLTDIQSRLKSEMFKIMDALDDPLRLNYSQLPPWGTVVKTGEMGP